MAFDIDSIGNTALNIVMILLSLLFAGCIVIGIVWLWIRKKKFNQYDCIIWKKDAFDKVEEIEDKGGVFIDKATNYKRLFLKKSSVSLSADNIPFIRRGRKKVIYLEQFGLKNFRFLKPTVVEGNVAIDVGEEDVNWAIVSYERGKKAFSTDRLLQFMPYILLGFVSLVILIMFIYLFKQLGTIKELFVAAESLTNAIGQARAGTVVITP